MVRKITKIKYKSKKEYTSRKEGIIVLCFDQDNEPVFMNAKTKAFRCSVETKLIAEIKNSYQLPKKQITIGQMTDIEKDIFSNTDGSVPSVAHRYDMESPKYKDIENELSAMKVFARLATCFQMDELIEVEGENITHWENFKVKKNNWIGLVEHLVNEDKMGLSLAEANLIATQIQSIKLGQKTLGEQLLDGEIKIDDLKSEIDKVTKAGEENEEE